MKAADMLSSGKAGMPFIKFVNGQDTEVFEKIITVMSKHMGRQTVEKMFKVRVREEVELDEKFEPKTAGMKITHKKPHPAGGHYVVLSKPGAGQHVIRHLNKGKVKTLGTVASLGLAKSYIDAKVKGKDPKDLIKKEDVNELNKDTLQKYHKKTQDYMKTALKKDDPKMLKKYGKRLTGSGRANDRLKKMGEGAMKRIATTQSNKAERIGSGGSQGLNTFKKKPQNEKLEVADGMGAWIDDFKQSDAPQFKGKNAKERRDMAIAAYLDAKKDSE
jgi:hypothetical protein